MANVVHRMSENDQAQLFIGNLPFEVDENKLMEMIKERDDSSALQSVKIIKSKETGESRGFGYATYTSKADAEMALAKLENLEIDGRSVKVDVSDKSNPKQKRMNTAGTDLKLFIGNLDFKATERDIMNLANDLLGENVAVRASIALERETKRPRGFGYIYFSNKDDLDVALGKLNGANLLNRDIRVDMAASRDDRKTPGTRDDTSTPYQRVTTPKPKSDFSLYLGNLAWEVTEKIIDEMLADVVGEGLVTNIRMATDRETGKSRGFCHVDFKDAESMERAMVELEGMSIYDRVLRIDKAQARERKPSDSQFSGKGRRRNSNERYSDSESTGAFSQW
jgi:RNA recognition motif-containing protein